MAFPASPIDGQTATVNNITYVYSIANNAWTRQLGSFVISNVSTVSQTVFSNATVSTSTLTGAVIVTGGVGVGGSLYITNTGDVSANLGAYQTRTNTAIASITTNANANTAAYLTTYSGNISSGNISTTGRYTVAFGPSSSLTDINLIALTQSLIA